MQQKTQSKTVVWEDVQDKISKEDRISTLGLVLDEEIAFKRVREDLIRLLSSECEDTGICAILDITQELLDKFKTRVKRKIRKIEVDLGQPSNTNGESQEVSFWEFVQQTTGDLDLLSWPSYYACMDCIKSEADSTLHAVDKSFYKSWAGHASGRGIFFQRPDLIKLLRLNFKRKYKADIIKYVNENKINVFRINCNEVDRTTLLPTTRVKGEHTQIRTIKFIFVTVQENLFKSVIAARRLSAQDTCNKVNQMLNVTNENVIENWEEG